MSARIVSLVENRQVRLTGYRILCLTNMTDMLRVAAKAILTFKEVAIVAEGAAGASVTKKWCVADNSELEYFRTLARKSTIKSDFLPQTVKIGFS